MKLISTNPSQNYQIIGDVNISTEAEIKEKVQKARTTLSTGSTLPLEQRITHLRRVIATIEKKQTDLALLMSREMGMPIRQSTDDLMYSIEFLNWYCDHAAEYLAPETIYEDDHELHRVFREPRGVVAIIVPWNFPMSNFVWQTGQNLIAGNTVIFKHSEENPLFGKALEDIFTEAKFPPGVFNEIYGDGKVGDILVHQQVDMICFTGSTKTGQYLYKIAAEKMIPVLMELGGSAPGIVFEDADIDAVLPTIYTNRFINCGQICDGLKRLIVHERTFEETIKKLTTELTKKKIGDAEDNTTDIGPLVAKRQLELLESQVADAIQKGATIVIGGKRPEGLQGAYYEPTILTNVTKEMRVWNEEVFGPVLPVVSFKTEAEAITLANDTDYGLGGYIFTKDSKRFERVAKAIQTGMVSQNNLSYVRACNPFGGYKKSGLGREHGKFGFHEVTQIKLIVSEK